MIDKQIIIDGVDVSGCSYYQHNMCTATKDDYGDCSLCCQDYNMNDCYYKQLKRKEQECEELKQTFTEIKEICNSVENIENVNSLYDAKLSGMFLQANKILQKVSECEVEDDT